MKKHLLIIICLTAFGYAQAQNINDNKVSFNYIQLPLIKIDKAFTKYEVRVTHSYKQANEDSLALFEMQKVNAEQNYNLAKANYQRKRDSLERQYLKSLSTWEKQMNAGTAQANGLPFPKPNPPVFPEPPMYQNVKAPRLHSDYDEGIIQKVMNIEGFEQGLGGSMLTIKIQPIRDIRIVQTIKGTGAATKYQYNCEYVLPIEIKLETPTQGVLLERIIFNEKRSYGMKEQSSQYDHQLFMLDNADQFYADLESYARNNAIKEASNYVNDQVGYVNTKRNTEVYSVKSFKDHDYTDVTNAYSATVQALSMLSKDRDCSGAQDKLEAAMKQWEEVMMESNTYDNKARINDKISAMIQCNMAEIQLWQAKFSEANATLNIAKNAGVFKAKSHANSMESFYAERQKRWEVNY